jgi:hypothetical protein
VRERNVKGSRATGAVLEYARGAAGELERIVLGSAPPRPEEVFPPVCCVCEAGSEVMGRVAYRVRVPMCRRCRRRWNWIRTVIVAVPTILVVGYFWWGFWTWFPTKRHTAGDWFLLGTITVGMATSIPAMMAVFVAWTIFPARVIKYKNGPKLYLSFRNAAYHRMTREWMAGGRTAAEALGGFPLPPTRLKGEIGG